MKYLPILALILLAGCQAVKSATIEPMVLDTPITITVEKAASVSVEPSPAASAPEPEVAAPVQRNSIVQYTIESCSWCKYDRKNVLPRWVAKGWIWRDGPDHVIDETANPKGAYPRYEIYDKDGTKTTHHGSLLSWKP